MDPMGTHIVEISRNLVLFTHMYLRSQRSAVARRLAEDAAAQANGQVVWDHVGTHGWHSMANFPAGTVRGSSIPSRVHESILSHRSSEVGSQIIDSEIPEEVGDM